MKKYVKAFPNKWVYLIILILFLGVLFIPLIYRFITFDIDVPNLANFNGIEIRNLIFKNDLSLDLLLFEFDYIQGIYLNILFIAISFGYQFLKKG